MPVKVREYASPFIARKTRDPFKVLVVTILSQSCTDVSAMRAYRNLERHVGVTPKKLAGTKVRAIESAIKMAGLQKQKARALKELSKELLENYAGDIRRILNRPFDEARAKLIELPKVGPKTADVMLLVEGRKTISVDTHVDRVSKRLGLVPAKANYEATRQGLMQLYRPDDFPDVPTYFMALGRRVCKAPKPRCPICPVASLCLYPHKTKEL
jgi:endonuclease-3